MTTALAVVFAQVLLSTCLAENIALNKSAYQIGSYGGAKAYKAVDGKYDMDTTGSTDDYFQVCARTNTVWHDNVPGMWYVDLMDTYVIYNVTVYNTYNEVVYRFMHDFRVDVVGPDNVTSQSCGVYNRTEPVSRGGSHTFDCHNTKGRFVYITKLGGFEDQMHFILCEVEVDGSVESSTTTAATTSTTTSTTSSTTTTTTAVTFRSVVSTDVTLITILVTPTDVMIDTEASTTPTPPSSTTSTTTSTTTPTTTTTTTSTVTLGNWKCSTVLPWSMFAVALVVNVITVTLLLYLFWFKRNKASGIQSGQSQTTTTTRQHPMIVLGKTEYENTEMGGRHQGSTEDRISGPGHQYEGLHRQATDHANTSPYEVIQAL